MEEKQPILECGCTEGCTEKEFFFEQLEYFKSYLTDKKFDTAKKQIENLPEPYTKEDGTLVVPQPKILTDLRMARYGSFSFNYF